MPFPKVRLGALVGRSCDMTWCMVDLMFVCLHDLKQGELNVRTVCVTSVKIDQC